MLAEDAAEAAGEDKGKDKTKGNIQWVPVSTAVPVEVEIGLLVCIDSKSDNMTRYGCTTIYFPWRIPPTATGKPH